MYKSIKEEKGITIIETTIALIFFSIIFITFIAVTQRGLLLTADQQHRNNAINLARQKIETLKHLDGGQFTRDSIEWQSEINKSDDEKDDEKNTIGNISYTIYTNYYDVSDGEINDDPNIIPINVTVVWNENGEKMRISLDTIYYANPIEEE